MSFRGWTASGIASLKIPRADCSAGAWLVRSRFDPGRVSKSTAILVQRRVTPRARWDFLEYDFRSTAGYHVHDGAGSANTVDAFVDDDGVDNDGPTDVLLIVEGTQLKLATGRSVENISVAPETLAAHEPLAVA